MLSPALRWLTIGLLVSVGIVAFDGLGVTTALPRIAGELDGMNTYGWAVSALMLASVIGTVIGGFIADRHGPRTPYIAGFLIFIAGLIVSASASTWMLFLLGRIVQGLGVGAIMSMAYVIVAIAYPQQLQARALALLSGAWTVPALVGPLVSSALTEFASWRFLFIGLIPLVLIAGALTLRGLPAIPASSGQRQGGGLSRQLVFSIGLAVSAAVLLAGLEQRNLALLAVMVIIGAVVMILTLRQVTPTGTLTARRGVPAGIATRAALSMAFFGIETFLPLAMTELRGATLFVAGLGVAAGALVWVAGSMLQSRHEMRSGTGTRRTDSILGLVILAIGIAVIAATLLGEVLPVWVAILGWVIGGFGMGLAYNASTAETFSETEPAAIGQMSGTIQMAQTLGTATIAGLGTAIISWTGEGSGLLSAMTAIFALTGLFALAAIPLAVRIRRDTPAGEV
ncbi:MFS transporter [Brevibacterium casei]|uniref:MFS transporter n=1 Tax=Brevibacterium casei TaxID=33889 RepID=UPI003F7F7091